MDGTLVPNKLWNGAFYGRGGGNNALWMKPKRKFREQIG